jgi:8-oxo-dGTP diphosphatase
MLDSVDVVVGILLKQDKFLVERRRMDKKVDPGIVCLPAGHVNPDESVEDALRREMDEELGIKVKEFRFVCSNYYVASNGERQYAHCYLITDYEGTPVCNEAQEIFWENDIYRFDLDVDRETVTKVWELLKE